ncbi:MAG: hypothetical protein JRE16_03230 [Deltaproteobacteria bacterium]|nr:hypothetical protein [Deltaproteobacteria bacterium]
MNNTDVGISYSHTVDTGKQGFVLGGDATSGTTEAEICWNCHIGLSPIASEWGTNTGGSYNYGSLHNTSGDGTASPGNHLNWSNGYWKSANFTYKNGPLDTRPVDGNADPGSNGAGRGSASIHATAVSGGWPGSSDTLADVSCSYCHDVHDTNTAAGDSASGAPYLRGTWRSSPYPEDGAPLSGTVYNDAGTPYANTNDGPPRVDSANNTLGGWQIDQNNGNPNSTYVYTSDDTLCGLCHDQPTLQTSAPLHKNSVRGFTNDTAGARDIFKNADRTTVNTRLDPGMAYQGVTDYADNKGWMGGFRNELQPGSAALGVNPMVDNQSYGYQSGNFPWSFTVTTSQVLTDFHSFSCSKCHTPHASRLPRLMITNCLDVQRNTWDDAYIGDASWGSWPALTPSSGNEGYRELAYAKSAQNCHRYFPAQTGSGTGSYTGNGWNSVTPW